jgi:predicted RNase H-like HicB family nuclease
MKYPVIFEGNDESGWGAYPPDLPGVGITAKTHDAARTSIAKAIKMHLAGMREDGIPIPPPSLCEHIKYPVIFERSKDGGWGAYSPSLPGVGIGAKSQKSARASIKKAIKMHLDGMREDWLPIPPSPLTEYIEAE